MVKEAVCKWHRPKNKMPKTGQPVLVKGKDRCVWLLYWDGDVWVNANSSDRIWMNKDYVKKWMKIPE